MNKINVKHKGVLVSLSNEKFIIPPLTIHSLKILEDDIKNLQISQNLDSLNSFLNILVCALKRNYPEIKVEDIEDLIEFDQIAPLFQIIMSS